MIKVLLVGEHPETTTGNAHMITQLARSIDTSKYEFSIFAMTHRSIISYDIFQKPDFPIIDGASAKDPDKWMHTLADLVDKKDIDIVMFVGLDIWMYHPILEPLKKLQNTSSEKFSIIGLFPYELVSVRRDWVEWMKLIDFPCVYSEYGKNMLKKHVPDIRYFRPPLYDAEKFVSVPKEEKEKLKYKYFKNELKKNSFLYGFFGANQIRKDPQRMIRSFFEVRKKYPNAILYLHTETEEGDFNIRQYVADCGNVKEVFIKQQRQKQTTESLVDFYNCMDCIVNTSFQEGLSWTIVEAMLCGIPIIASNNTAHIELLRGGCGYPVLCNELNYLPVVTANGRSWIETKACDPKKLTEAMMAMLSRPESYRQGFIDAGLKRGKEWVEGVSNINDLLDEAAAENAKRSFSAKAGDENVKDKKVLFAQHSSAGDVLMTTQALKGLKQRHPSLPLVYMTSERYMDILVNNPYVDEVIPWNVHQLSKYFVVYNPHGERIGPGHWGRNSNSLLSDFYWKLVKVEPSEFFIEKKPPEKSIVNSILGVDKPICILHTTGGDPEFRTYKYMNDVARALGKNYVTVQVGGERDYPAKAQIDLRGKLSFRESAWVVSYGRLAVTVDSFISHLCGALGVSQVCLFGSGNYYVVRPKQVKGILVNMTPDYIRYCPGLGPCSASIRNCPMPCTGIHDPVDIIKNLMYIENTLRKGEKKE